MAKSRKSAKTGGAKGGNHELLSWALQGLEQAIASTRERLHELEAQARKLMSTSRAAKSAEPARAAAPKPARKKRKLSADARRRIAEAQKRRWAKTRAAKE